MLPMTNPPRLPAFRSAARITPPGVSNSAGKRLPAAAGSKKGILPVQSPEYLFLGRYGWGAWLYIDSGAWRGEDRSAGETVHGPLERSPHAARTQSDNGEHSIPLPTSSQAQEGWDEMFDRVAAGLYNLAAMLVGEGEEGARLVENAISAAEISVCQDPEQARALSRQALCKAAIETMGKRNPASLAAPEGSSGQATCIEDDDLDAAGVSREELERMMSGPDHERVKKWLESLPAKVRTVFVLRAVAGIAARRPRACWPTWEGCKLPDGLRKAYARHFARGSARWLRN